MLKHRLFTLAASLLLVAMAAFAQVGAIDGIVQLPDNGGPAVGATVTIHRMLQDSLSTTTDSSGQFSFDSVAVGEWGVNAYLAPYFPAFAVAHVRANETAHLTLNLMNPPTGYGRVEGIVLFPNEGGPAAGATVVLFRAHGDSLVTVSDDSGHFAFDSARVGEHDIHASLTGYLTVYGEVRVPDGGTAHITLVLRPIPTGYGRVEGIVLLPNEGGPAAGATVVLFRAHGDSLVTVSDDSGHFAFDSARVGEHDIHASLTGYRTVYGEVHVPDGGTAHIVLVLRSVGGTVEGFVTLSDQTPVNHALVRLEGEGEHHGENEDYHTQTDSTGHFSMEHVQAGAYTITAMAFMHGFASAEIVVVDSQVTEVTLVLNDSTNGGHHHGDTLATVELTGIALVVYPDSVNHPHRISYYIDVNYDGEADYRLSFGPPWYEPRSGASRPANGDSISVYGGLLTFSTPPMVVVYEINGLLWREPFHGHGGHGGGDHGHEGCNSDSVTRVELAGTAMVFSGEGCHGERTLYAIAASPGNMTAFLDFGRPDYDPGNGALRPQNGDEIAIVGGQIYCPNAPVPTVIVYEINGLFWREPGDTVGLGALPESVEEPVTVGAPLTHLIARNYPNPFNPTTTIRYSIPVSGHVNLTVYDLQGREVAVLVNGIQTAATYAVTCDGSAFTSGVYFYRLTAGNETFTGRMMLLK
jgi:hypothetical protein